MIRRRRLGSDALGLFFDSKWSSVVRAHFPSFFAFPFCMSIPGELKKKFWFLRSLLVPKYRAVEVGVERKRHSCNNTKR
jgi:hypothetical protein